MHGSSSPGALVLGLLLSAAMPLQAGSAAANGATDAATSPVGLAEGITRDTAALGPEEGVTGTVKGVARAAGQRVTGAANVGVGIVELLVSPFTRR